MWCARLTLRGESWPALYSAAGTSRGPRAPHPHMHSAQDMVPEASAMARSLSFQDAGSVGGRGHSQNTQLEMAILKQKEYSSLILHARAAAIALASPLEGREMRLS